MRSVAEHRAAVRALLEPIATRLETEELPVDAEAIAATPADYAERILARDLDAPLDLPPFDNSQMDGYAVRAEDVAASAPDAPARLDVAATVAAGDRPGPLANGTAAPIMTGAPIPRGADAVIPIEDATPPRFGDEASVAFAAPVPPGNYIRRRGSDIRAGARLLDAGVRLTPAHWGVLAASGIPRAPVRRRPRVLVVSTGQELHRGEAELGPGRIHDANGAGLAAALAGAGASARVAATGDDPDELVAVLSAYVPDTDLAVTTGGVSQGAFEVVRQALEPFGAEFVSVAMQPGGPQGLGAVALPGEESGRLPVVAFPGNPVSALVSFEMFLRPVLRRIAGLPRPDRPREAMPLAESIDSPPGKHQVRRGVETPDGTARILGGPGSHLLHAYAASGLLIQLPVGLGRVEAGTPVEVWRIDE